MAARRTHWPSMGFSPEHTTFILEREMFLPFLSLLNSSRKTSYSVHSVTPAGLPTNTVKKEVLLLYAVGPVSLLVGFMRHQ